MSIHRAISPVGKRQFASLQILQKYKYQTKPILMGNYLQYYESYTLIIAQKQRETQAQSGFAFLRCKEVLSGSVKLRRRKTLQSRKSMVGFRLYFSVPQ